MRTHRVNDFHELHRRHGFGGVFAQRREDLGLALVSVVDVVGHVFPRVPHEGAVRRVDEVRLQGQDPLQGLHVVKQVLKHLCRKRGSEALRYACSVRVWVIDLSVKARHET